MSEPTSLRNVIVTMLQEAAESTGSAYGQRSAEAMADAVLAWHEQQMNEAYERGLKSPLTDSAVYKHGYNAALADARARIEALPIPAHVDYRMTVADVIRNDRAYVLEALDAPAPTGQRERVAARIKEAAWHLRVPGMPGLTDAEALTLADAALAAPAPSRQPSLDAPSWTEADQEGDTSAPSRQEQDDA